MEKPKPEGNEDIPQFDLSTENELLKLKLKAEFGAECSTGHEKIPDVVVNEFLRSVYEFEQKFRGPRSYVRIFERAGSPYFRKSAGLTDNQLSGELKRLMKALQDHRLQLDIMGTYPDRHIYKFITEEFFYVEIEDVDMPGFVHHFCYEDFHPNHEVEIRQRVVEFLSEWFGRQINEYSLSLADVFIHPDSREFSKASVLARISNIFKAYQSYTNCEYLVTNLRYDFNQHKNAGRAFVEGRVRYDAILENGESIHVEGPFELYMSNSGSWWSIFYFVFPGFVWR